MKRAKCKIPAEDDILFSGGEISLNNYTNNNSTTVTALDACRVPSNAVVEINANLYDNNTMTTK